MLGDLVNVKGYSDKCNYELKKHNDLSALIKFEDKVQCRKHYQD